MKSLLAGYRIITINGVAWYAPDIKRREKMNSSIFNGTMADMTYLEIEKLIEQVAKRRNRR